MTSLTMLNEKLCVKWNENLQERLDKSFGELRDGDDFTDVTLACEDESVKAHKVILSASSPFFNKLLKSIPHPRPLIYMRGVKGEDLVAMVDFIYLGEANILQEQLERFLSLAEELELKGMARNDVTEELGECSNIEVTDELRGIKNTSVEYRTTISALKDQYRNPKQPKPALKKEEIVNVSVVPQLKMEADEIEVPNPSHQMKTTKTAFIAPEIKAKIDSMISRLDDGLYTCSECEYTSKVHVHMREHVEKHIEGLEYPCNFCDKVLRSSSVLRKHKSKHH